MAISPKVRNGLLHVGTAFSASAATAMWLSSHSVDLYAVVDQLNAVIAAVIKLGTTVGALITGAYAVYNSTTKGLVADVAQIAKQPDSPVKAIITENTVEGRKLAESISIIGPAVQAGTVDAALLADGVNPTIEPQRKAI